MTRKTLLQRRQRTTLSQLRSGHCKLLNSYKKWLKQSDSTRCPDCGMDPQDVPHLFDCVAHPNDLSPVNLWDKPIETNENWAFWTRATWIKQTRMVEEGIQHVWVHVVNERVFARSNKYTFKDGIHDSTNFIFGICYMELVMDSI